MCTLPRNTTRAMVPPISAAAMLSRNDDSTNTRTSSTKPPFQSPRQEARQHRGNVRVLEVLRQQGEPHQQAEEVRERHPLVAEHAGHPREPRARSECR